MLWARQSDPGNTIGHFYDQIFKLGHANSPVQWFQGFPRNDTPSPIRGNDRPR
jgi:hypothetical protein